MQSTQKGRSIAANNAIPGTCPAVLPFPHEGKVRAKQIAKFLSIGLSSWWLYVKLGRVKEPMRLSPRVSVWDAAYIRDLAANGIPEANQQEV